MNKFRGDLIVQWEKLDGARIDPQISVIFLHILQQFIENPDQIVVSEKNDTEDGIIMELTINDVRYSLSCSNLPLSHKSNGLSPREKEIVRLVAKGLATKAIGAILEVSPWTVTTHLRRIFYKLGVNSRAEMVARAMHQSMLE
jgi:DNA-binding CsgD family transcriptional regulator